MRSCTVKWNTMKCGKTNPERLFSKQNRAWKWTPKKGLDNDQRRGYICSRSGSSQVPFARLVTVKALTQGHSSGSHHMGGLFFVFDTKGPTMPRKRTQEKKEPAAQGMVLPPISPDPEAPDSSISIGKSERFQGELSPGSLPLIRKHAKRIGATQVEVIREDRDLILCHFGHIGYQTVKKGNP